MSDSPADRLWHWFRQSPFSMNQRGGHVLRRLDGSGAAFLDSEGGICCELSAETLFQIQSVERIEKVIDPWSEK